MITAIKGGTIAPMKTMKSFTKFAVLINWTIPFVAQTSEGKKDDGANIKDMISKMSEVGNPVVLYTKVKANTVFKPK
jgi:hypothetical protein